MTSGIGHPHIVQVFDFGAAPTGEPFLVMEFLDGEDLEHRIRRVGRLTTTDTLHVIRQVAAALIATHAKGIVHRDLKPANIYLLEAAGERDFVKVVDFGISKVQAATTKLTNSSTVMGTPNYMSPEQALGRVDEIDHSTDQWALACIAWEALSGECPFVGGNVASILFQVVHESPAPLAAKLPGLRPEIEQALRRALSKAKAERFPSVAELWAALEDAAAKTSPAWASAALSEQTKAATEPLPPQPAGPATDLLPSDDKPPAPTTFTRTAGELGDSPAHPRSRARLVWVLAVGAVVVLAVGLFVFSRPASAPKPTNASAPAVVLPSPDPRPALLPAPMGEPAAAPPPSAPAATATMPASEEAQTAAAKAPTPGRTKRRARAPVAGEPAAAPAAPALTPPAAPAPIPTPAATPAPTTGPRGGSKW